MTDERAPEAPRDERRPWVCPVRVQISADTPTTHHGLDAGFRLDSRFPWVWGWHFNLTSYPLGGNYKDKMAGARLFEPAHAMGEEGD